MALVLTSASCNTITYYAIIFGVVERTAMSSPVTLRLRAATRQRIARLARRQRVSVSDVMREAIEEWVDRHEAADSPFDAVADLIGVVRGGNPNRSSDAGRQFAKLLKKRRRH